MTVLRISCPACGQLVVLTASGRLRAHGKPRCRQRLLGRVWPTRHHGRRVRTIPGPDTWNPKGTP